MPEHSVVAKPWSALSPEEVYAVARLRTTVFYREQKVDDDELDGRDLEPGTVHWWIEDGEGIAAYLRTLLDPVPEHLDAGRVIGRVVTRADRRGEGLAHALVAAAVARYGSEAMMLHAQSRVASLYERSGFESFGPEYDEAGIAHVSMYRSGRAG